MNIKEFRAKNNLTQTALAKALGVSPNAISAIESGRMKLSPRLSAKIEEVYGETVEQAVVVKAAGKKGEAKVEKKTRKPRQSKKAAEAPAVVEAPPEKKTRKTAKKAVVEKPAAKKAAPSIVIQSPFGGEITMEALIAKVGEADSVYVRADQNKAYWVKGEETGDVDLW